MANLKDLDPADAKATLKAMSKEEKQNYTSDWTGKSGITAWIDDLSRFTSAATAQTPAPTSTEGGAVEVIIKRTGKDEIPVSARSGVNLFRLLQDANVPTAERDVSVVKPDMTAMTATATTTLSEGKYRVNVSQRVEGGC